MNKRILIVEDNELNMKLFNDLLEAHGYVVDPLDVGGMQTLCRALNIPARLVVGYVYFDEPPQDFHAVFEAWLAEQEEARIVTAYIGQGAPRFYMAMGPELPDPSFAKIVVLVFIIMFIQKRPQGLFALKGRFVEN